MIDRAAERDLAFFDSSERKNCRVHGGNVKTTEVHFANGYHLVCRKCLLEVISEFKKRRVVLDEVSLFMNN